MTDKHLGRESNNKLKKKKLIIFQLSKSQQLYQRDNLQVFKVKKK